MNWSPELPGWSEAVASLPEKLPVPAKHSCTKGPVLVVYLRSDKQLDYVCTLPNAIRRARDRLITVAHATPS